MCAAAWAADTNRLVDKEVVTIRALAQALGAGRPPARLLAHREETLRARCQLALARCSAAGAEPAVLVAALARRASGSSTPRGEPDETRGPTARSPGTLGASCAAYLDHLARSHYSPTTRTVRRVHLRLFCGWAASQGVEDTGAVTRALLERYQDHLCHHRTRTGAPLTIASQATRLAHLRAWWAWIARTSGLPNPTTELVLPRLGVPLPPVLSAADAERVLAQPDVTTPIGVRDRAILEVFYATGMRRTELLQLTLGALDRPRRRVTIRQGKGRRDRTVPLGDRAAAWLDRYLGAVRPRWARDPDPGTVFLTAREAPLHPNHLSALVRGYVRAAQLGPRGACHLFRHTTATLMLEGGADIRVIQELLGHAKLTTTQVYTHVSIRHLQAVYATTHPAARGAEQAASGLPEGTP